MSLNSRPVSAKVPTESFKHFASVLKNNSIECPKPENTYTGMMNVGHTGISKFTISRAYILELTQEQYTLLKLTCDYAEFAYHTIVVADD